MKVTNRKNLNRFIQLKKTDEASQIEMNEFFRALRENRVEILNSTGSVNGKEESVTRLVANNVSGAIPAQSFKNDKSLGGIFTNKADMAALAPSGLFYKQESVLSVIRDFYYYDRISYDVDFTSDEINQADCRNLMKFMLAIVISEVEDEISEEVIEKI